MTLLIEQPTQDEQRVVIHSLSWQQYESLLATLGDCLGLRLIYLEGALEIFMPSAKHEQVKTVIARLLERYAEEVDIPLHGYGSTTFRREAKARGLETDECYCVGAPKETPDLAIEVVLSSGGLDKLDVYQGLGVPEVLIWQNDQLMLYDLQSEERRVVDRSQFFPDLNLLLLAQYIQPENQPQAVKDFLQALRSSG